jgi:copper chaperone CopZ
MLTSVEVLNANCPTCLNDASTALMKTPGVNEVHHDSSNGCLQVQHDLSDPTTITDVLSRELRGWCVDSNGDVEMVHTSPTLTTSCKVHLAPLPVGANRVSTPAATRTVGETAM